MKIENSFLIPETKKEAKEILQLRLSELCETTDIFGKKSLSVMHPKSWTEAVICTLILSEK